MIISPDNYAVFGNPIAHSKSPILQQMFAEQTGQHIRYSAEAINPEIFEKSVKRFFDLGGKGLNITVPFKERACQFADSLTLRAQTAGAVNTLFLDSSKSIVGDNTDGIGLVNDISNNLNWDIANKRILIIGAGGAVRGILEPFIAAGPSSISIVNRTYEKAKSLAKEFTSLFPVEVLSFDELSERSFDIIINGTSASLSGNLTPLPSTVINSKTCCYDLMYSNVKTPFLEWAEHNGCQFFSDGLGMLVCQGAESFNIWRGVMPETKPIISFLRKNL